MIFHHIKGQQPPIPHASKHEADKDHSKFNGSTGTKWYHTYGRMEDQDQLETAST